MAGFQLAGPAADVSKSLYDDFHKSYQSPNAQCDNFSAPARAAAERENFEELDATDLKRAFGSGKVWESKVILQFVWQNQKSWYKCRFRFFFYYKIVW